MSLASLADSTDTSITSDLDSDFEDAEGITAMISEDLCVMSIALSARAEKFTRERMNWFLHCQRLIYEGEFHKSYRMSFESFSVLLDLLRPRLQINETLSRNSTGQVL